LLERGRFAHGGVSGGLSISVCSACGHAVFPARLLCPQCGSDEWRSEDVGAGVVEEATLVERAPGGPLVTPVALGSIQLERGLVVVARLEARLERGDSVRLEYRDGVPVAYPTAP
jgi:uncharacterized OB-fold protein